MNEIISGALKDAKVSRRHPADVTADRLGDAVQRWHDRFESAELDMVGVVISRLRIIADGGDPDAED